MKRLIAAVALSSLALSASALEIGKPYEELDIERALPNVVAGHADAASTGSTQAAQSSWANDYNFIAPAM
jgi:hypothetical protein